MSDPDQPKTRDFAPAIKGKHGLRLYDPLIRLTLREYTFKRRLLKKSSLPRGARILDVGCGTGTLLKLAKKSWPGAALTGIDVDDRILRLAAEKTSAPLTRATASALPFTAAHFDAAFATLVFHHLLPEERKLAFAEILRVLRPGAWLHAADFGKPRNRLMGLLGKLVRLEDGEERTRDCFEGLLPGLLTRAGFVQVSEWEYHSTPFGTLVLFSAQKPA